MSIEKSQLIAIREFVPGDYNFVVASWIDGLRHGHEFFNLMDKEAYYKHFRKIILDTLEDPSTTVKVACLRDDPEVILGYSVLRNGESTLDWVFVKSAWRNIGVAKSLLSPKVKTVTYITKPGVSILKKHPELSYNPYT